MENSAKLCVKNDIHSVGRAGQKVNGDFGGNSQALNSCFFSGELNKHLDIEVKSVGVRCESDVVSFIVGF